MKRNSEGARIGGFAVAAVAGLATCLSIGTASADNVFIGLQQNQGGVVSPPIMLVASGTNTAAFSGSFGAFTVDLVTGFASTAPGVLISTEQTTIGAVGPGPAPQLSVFVTVTGLALPTPGYGFESDFTSNAIQSPAGRPSSL